MFKIGQVRFASFQHLPTVFIGSNDYNNNEIGQKKKKKKRKKEKKELTRRFTIKQINLFQRQSLRFRNEKIPTNPQNSISLSHSNPTPLHNKKKKKLT